MFILSKPELIILCIIEVQYNVNSKKGERWFMVAHALRENGGAVSKLIFLRALVIIYRLLHFCCFLCPILHLKRVGILEVEFLIALK